MAACAITIEIKSKRGKDSLSFLDNSHLASLLPSLFTINFLSVSLSLRFSDTETRGGEKETVPMPDRCGIKSIRCPTVVQYISRSTLPPSSLSSSSPFLFPFSRAAALFPRPNVYRLEIRRSMNSLFLFCQS